MNERYIKKRYFNATAPGSLGGLSGFIRSNKRFKDKGFVETTLNNLRTFSIHKPIRRHWIRRRVIVAFPREICAIDLIDYSMHKYSNSHYNWILVIVDVFSKYLWAYPLKNKSANSVYEALAVHFKHPSRRCHRLWSDFGKEIWNKKVMGLLEKYKIKLYKTYSKLKSVWAERSILTIKSKLQRYFTFSGKSNWTKVLPNLIDSLNNTYQVRLGTSPASVTFKNADKVWHRQYKALIGLKPRTPKFNVNDLVRIGKNKLTFEKSYLPGWTNEIFKVTKVQLTLPVPTYKLSDQQGEDISGQFYEEELNRVMTKKNTDDD